MPMHKKTSKKMNLIKLLKVIFTVFLVYIGIALMFEGIPLFNRYQHYVIVSASMEPVINVGDVVVINQKVNYEDLAVDDIVAVNVTINNQDVVVVHYIHSITTVNGSTTYLTRPEGETEPDSWELSKEDINGVYVFRIQKVGSFLLFAQSTIGRIVIVVDIIIIYIVYKMFFKKN
ncbi:signal peptidase I [Liberiplasma polymorphum]|uniref:signal peptidase I n=1 Tax=Liberiplasma polymorphum TaxID=3374570 RepID=UPI003776A9B2